MVKVLLNATNELMKNTMNKMQSAGLFCPMDFRLSENFAVFFGGLIRSFVPKAATRVKMIQQTQ